MRKLLVSCLVLAYLLVGVSPIRAAEPRTNVVFILVDDLRWDSLGCAGHPFVKTPSVDRLAKEGALFQNAFVTTPLCSPSRASFLTGQYIRTHGIKSNGDNSAVSHRLVTWPRLLHDAGYQTAFVGKWHMGRDDSPRPGFDRWVSFKGQGVYQDPSLNIDGKPAKEKGYITDLLNSHAVEFVKKARSKPFALYLSHKAIHGPFTPAERHKDLYEKDNRPLPPSVTDDWSGKPALKHGAAQQKLRPKARKPAPGRDSLMRQQLRCMASIDEGVGQLLKALDETKQLDKTLFVFTSDNGYFWGEHRLGDKRAAYEESIRIPLVIRWPGRIKPGTKVAQLALNIDMAPTFLDAAGVKIPATVEGKSLLPLFGNGAKSWRTSFLIEYDQEKRFPRIPTWEGIRGDRWKYIHYPDLAGADELYDLKADPYEMKNTIQDPAARDALKQLQTDLARYTPRGGKREKS
jgi:N-acetylglucosamine-6-sulfatase